MTSHHGKFIWYELMTTDAKAAEAFYRGVMGWNMKDAGMPDMAYTILNVGETGMGGLMTMPPAVRAAGGRPGWVGYIAAEDVDVYAGKVKAAGGSVHHAPEDIPGVGRFAVVADPHGAVFVLFKGTSQPPPSPAPNTPGYTGWHELYAGDRESAFAFYAGLFGWTKADAVDMGPMGIYQLFATGGPPVGGMMTKPEQIPMPCWLYYFNVDDAHAAAARVKQHGGEVLMGPHEVPGGMLIVQCRDPQGAMFAVVGPPR